MTSPLDPESYQRELTRTAPDLVVHRPSAELGPDAENQQVIGTVAANGDFLVTWTTASKENDPNQRVVLARSSDHGATWSEPVEIDGPTPEQMAGPERGMHLASWSFFVHAPALGRLYLFYCKNIGVIDARADTTGILRFRLSEDDGRTWSAPHDHLRIRRSPIDHADPAVPVNFVPCFQSFHGPDGVPMATITRWGSGNPDLLNVQSEIWLLRFDNILTERDPEKLTMSTLPDGEHGIRVPHPFRMGMSCAQEAMVVNLPDGRLFTVFRTLQGCNYWSTSKDGGHTWETHWQDYKEPRPLEAFPLRFTDTGGLVRNPIVCSPVFQYDTDKFFHLFYNNDGYAYGATHPADYQKNRREVWIVCGKFDPDARQPVQFGEPRLLMDTAGVYLGPTGRAEACSYPSYFQHGGTHYLWYSDRKHFVLGKVLNPWLE